MDRQAFRETMSSDRAVAHADPDALIRFEALLVELSTRFINLAPADIDREIEDALRRVCERLDIDLAVLWQWSVAVPEVIAPTHVYPKPGGSPPFDPLNQESYPWVVRQMLAGRIVRVSGLDELPEEAVVDRENARLSGIISNLCLPLAVGGGPAVGALAFSTTRAPRMWSEELGAWLQLVAQVFANALARRRSDESLRRSEARLSAGADLAGLGYYEVDFANQAAYVDDRFVDICGVPADQREGLQPLTFWIDHLHPEDHARVMDARRQLHEGIRDPFSVEYRFLNPTRGEIWIHHQGRVRSRGADGRPTRTIGVLRDVTDERRAEDELRGLSRRLIRAQEEERALLARELHDDVTQRLAVLAIDVGRAELGAAGGAHAELMASVRDGLVRLSEDIHSLAYQLHPSVLEELGLVEALRTECERRSRRSRIRITFDLQSIGATIGRDSALCLYRVAQEALTNVTRHSGAEAASIVLRPMDGGVLLAVRDDGGGFDPEAARRGRSLGLASMRERVQLVNGTLDIESAPGSGTAIVAWVPGEGESP